jgi:hypothetical protein
VRNIEEAGAQLWNRRGLCARAVAAGTIASRNGNPNATPAPFRTALREMCFFVMNMFYLLL